MPARTTRLPALGAELLGVRAPGVGTSVQSVRGGDDDLAFGYQDRACAVGAAAGGEHGVAVGDAAVGWGDGVEAEGWVLLGDLALVGLVRGKALVWCVEKLTFFDDGLQVVHVL